MAKKKRWLIIMLLGSSFAFAESTSTIIVGPSATVNIDSNGNSVSASAGALILKSGDAENTDIEVKTIADGNVKASAILINDGEDTHIDVFTEIVNDDEIKVVVIEGGEKNFKIHLTNQTTTITIQKTD
ncbi:MAG: hypothetical protein DRR19_23890 [Candidatus Parabeggiatoa sp. nov. 1]|nr:MAG: hypothetical protein DRR19_23890 [Gammaproteobacteria bacterium]